MNFEYAYTLPLDEARARLVALGEYLTNKHGIKVTWEGDKAQFAGKYLVVKVEGVMTVAPDLVTFHGKDPGFLWRKKASDYIKGKLATYLNPATPLERLPRH